MAKKKKETITPEFYYTFKIDDDLRVEMNSKDYDQLKDIMVNLTECKMIRMTNYKEKDFYLIVPKKEFEIEARIKKD